MDPAEFGAFLRAERTAKGMTQGELADRLGVTGKAVSKWERGACLPDVSRFGDLAAALDLTELEILKARRLPPDDTASPGIPDSRTVPSADGQAPASAAPAIPDAPILTARAAGRLLLGCLVIALVCFAGDVAELRHWIPVQGLFWPVQALACVVFGVATARRSGPASVDAKGAALYALAVAAVLGLFVLFCLDPTILWRAQSDLLHWTLRIPRGMEGDIDTLARSNGLEWSPRGIWAKFVTEALLNEWSVAGLLLCLALYVLIRLVRALRGRTFRLMAADR